MRYARDVIVMSGIAVVVYCIVVFAGQAILESRVTPPVGLTLDWWLGVYSFWASCSVIGATLLAALWYLIGDLKSLNDWSNSGGRKLWTGLQIFALVVAIVCAYQLAPTEDAKSVAVGFVVLGALIGYYFMTVLASPASFKYTPPGARRLRRF